MRALASPASCKGVLSAVEASMALAAGMRTAGLEADELPVADGGEGTAEVFAAALGGEWRTVRWRGSARALIRGRYLVLDDGTAVVEAADADRAFSSRGGRARCLKANRAADSFELVSAAVEVGGAQALIVGLGDTATVDGGAGVARSLPDVLGRTCPSASPVDVRNPLLGERGAARAFGPAEGSLT